MQTIDFIHGKGYNVIEFPDGELHLVLDELNRKEKVNIKCRITNSNDLFLLMQLSDILKRQCMEVASMDIFYLMGMRCDRLFDINRPFTLGIIVDVINSLNAIEVILYEPHSNRTMNMINNCYERLTADIFFNTTKYVDMVMVVPDKGAKERYNYMPIGVVCSKVRDVATGKLLDFNAEEKTDVKGKNLFVIDDLCDGGGTFIGLAPKLRDLQPKSLSLLVTHAIQKSGIEKVASVYDNVYITDSYKNWTAEDLPNNVTVKTITEKD